MAIIYSYEQENNPQLSDLLLGTDVSASGKPTKLFSISSIVDLVQANTPGGGTVTSISTANDNFINMSGGPITTSGTISATLSATGVPSATTYLRGDNTWANIPAGVNTTYTLSSVQSGLNNNIRLTGSDSSQTVVSLIAGANIVLTNNGANGITLSVAGIPFGSVKSVTADGGLKLVTADSTENPILAIDLVGLNNYIKISQSQATAKAADIIAFNQDSSTSVKTTTFSQLPVEALTLVKNYVDAGDEGDVVNTTDTFTSTAPVKNVVTLTSAEYTALANKNANTLYLVAGPQTTYTTTLALTNNIVGTEYTIGGNQAGDTKTGIAGAAYIYNTTVVPNPGYYFSAGPSVLNAIGTFSTNETVYTILSGTVVPNEVPDTVATLSVSTIGVQGTQFTLTGDLNGATQSGSSPLTYAFNTNIVADAGYEFISGPTITNAAGTISTSQNVVTYITGVIEQVAPPEVIVTAQIVENFTGAAAAQGYTTVSPGSISGDSPLTYSFDVQALANSGYYFVSGPTITGDLSGSATASKNAVINVSGEIEAISNNAIVTLSVNNEITGPTAGYTLGGELAGTQKSGAIPFTYSFNTTVTLNSGYEWVGGTAPTIVNAGGTTNTIGNQTVITTISNAQVVETASLVTATLNVTYNISGPAVWSPAGYLTGETQSGLPPFIYDFGGVNVPTITLPSGYGFSVVPSTSGTLTGTIATNTTVPITVTATVVEVPLTGTVNLAFTDNIVGSENATFTLTPGTSISGNVGDPYTFTHSVVANTGYEFISGPTWSPSATISGTIPSGITTITQSVSGEVIAEPSGYCDTIFVSTNAYATPTLACGHQYNYYSVKYSAPACCPAYPVVGQTIYFSSSTCGGPVFDYDDGTVWRKIQAYPGDPYAIIARISSAGVVLQTMGCP